MISFFKQPRATVLIPTYGTAPFAEFSIKSVCNQTVRNIEILIICDGSPQEMVRFFNGMAKKDKRIKVFEFPKAPRTGEIHRDIVIRKNARGRNVFYCCHDDLWLPDHIKHLEKELKLNDFAHSIHMATDKFDKDNSIENCFNIIHFADLKIDSFRERMLSKTNMENFFGLSYAAHPRKSYLNLEEGWTTTPEGIWTDLYMWRKFLNAYRDSSGTCKKITALHFPVSLRREWSVAQRLEEVEFFYNKIQDPEFIKGIRSHAKNKIPELDNI